MPRVAPLFASLAFAAAVAAQSPRPLPPLAEATRIHDTKANTTRSWPELLDALSKHDVVFLGETHVDDTTHQVELHVLEQLLARRAGKVVLSMEMFERDVQPALDDYLAGRIDEASFLQRARPWQNYHTAYRPLIECAKAAKIPVVAANFPGTLRRAFAGDAGKTALDQLTPEQRALLPTEIFPASASYWELVDRAVRGHTGGLSGGTPEERRYDTQNLWDNAMGDNIARAKVAHPESLVLHIAGGFHVAYRDGTVAQFTRRSAQSTFAVVSIAPTAELHTIRPERDAAQADYLVYARTLARDIHDGNYAVEVPAELRYRLEVPDAGTNWPLLVWLPDGHTRTEDAVALWQRALGRDAAIAVVEAPFPEVQPDLALGGRYVFGDGFRADYSRMSHGIARIVEYATRRFPIDGARVVIAGEGAGGAAVLWTALYGEWLPNDFVALDPSDLGRLALEALPDQKPIAKSLHIATRQPEEPRIQKLVADYRKVGTTTTVNSTQSGGQLIQLLFNRLRLGGPGRPWADASRQAGTVKLVFDTPRAREWRNLYLGQLRPTDIFLSETLLQVGGTGVYPVSRFGSGRGIPLAGGPFGGTTIVVLPKGTSDADKSTWLEYEQQKILKKRSMFANIAIACEAGEPSLPQVVTRLKGMGRSRMLIVPALFCADAATMQGLQQQLGEAAAGLDLAWLPGLGAELATMPVRGH